MIPVIVPIAVIPVAIARADDPGAGDSSANDSGAAIKIAAAKSIFNRGPGRDPRAVDECIAPVERVVVFGNAAIEVDIWTVFDRRSILEIRPRFDVRREATLKWFSIFGRATLKFSCGTLNVGVWPNDCRAAPALKWRAAARVEMRGPASATEMGPASAAAEMRAATASAPTPTGRRGLMWDQRSNQNQRDQANECLVHDDATFRETAPHERHS